MKDGIIEARIWPRKSSDRGGIILMPLKKNIPAGHPDWTLTTCPNCGAECWRSALIKIAEDQGAKALCTECALKAGRKPKEAQR